MLRKYITNIVLKRRKYRNVKKNEVGQMFPAQIIWQ